MKRFKELFTELQALSGDFQSDAKEARLLHDSVVKLCEQRKDNRGRNYHNTVDTAKIDSKIAEDGSRVRSILKNLDENAPKLYKLFFECSVALHSEPNPKVFKSCRLKLSAYLPDIESYVALKSNDGAGYSDPDRMFQRNSTFRELFALLPNSTFNPNYLPPHVTHFISSDCGYPDPTVRNDITVKPGHFASESPSITNLTLAVAADNEALVTYLVKQLAKQASLSISDYVARHNLLYLAIATESCKVVDALTQMDVILEQNCELPVSKQMRDASQQMHTRKEVHCLTPLGLATHLASQYQPDNLNKVFQTLLNCGASYNANVTIKWTEHRGYMGKNLVEMKSTHKLTEYDKTGKLQPLIDSIKHSKHAKRNSSGVSMRDLLKRVEQLEKENSQLKREMASLKETVNTLSDGSTSKAKVKLDFHELLKADEAKSDTPSRRQTDMLCRFYKADKPDSCRNGDDCQFVHDTSSPR